MTPAATSDTTYAGQAVYSPMNLRLYDLIVLRISNRFIWRCPTRNILALYNTHVTDDHLDIGVGTGWYLDRCKFKSKTPNLGLMDLNPNSLAAASRRIARYQPQLYTADILRPLQYDASPFRSIAMTYLLHCLPGPMATKATAFDNVSRLLHPDGVVFGATLLSRGVKRSRIARALMRFYNRKGIFSNQEDTLDALRAALEQRFDNVKIQVFGCGALFTARARR